MQRQKAASRRSCVLLLSGQKSGEGKQIKSVCYTLNHFYSPQEGEQKRVGGQGEVGGRLRTIAKLVRASVWVTRWLNTLGFFFFSEKRNCHFSRAPFIVSES